MKIPKDGNAPLRAHELRLRATEPTADSAKASEEALEVVAAVHQAHRAGARVQASSAAARAELEREGAITLARGKLTIGARTLPVTPEQAGAMQLLAPNRTTLAGLWPALTGPGHVLIHAEAGAEADRTAAWLLSLLRDELPVVEEQQIFTSTTIFELAGAMRVNEKNELTIPDGKLVRVVRDGGVLLLTGFENADEDVRAMIGAIASGASFIQHPQSKIPIPVHPDTKLIVVGEPRGLAKLRMREDFIRASFSVPAYDRDEMAELLHKRHGVPRAAALQLADFQQAVVALADPSRAKGQAGLDFGLGFSFSWLNLDRVGQALALGEAYDKGAIRDALWAEYGARLGSAEQRARFGELLKGTFGMDEVEPGRPSRSRDPTYVHTAANDRALSQLEHALKSSRIALVSGPPQSGVTRLVEELGRRRGSPVATVMGHPSLHVQSHVETPSFDDKGNIRFTPGRAARVLMEGGTLYVDHFDHMDQRRQNAWLALAAKDSFTFIDEKGRQVTKPVSKKARIVLSTTTGEHWSRHKPSAELRAALPEIVMDGPSLDDLPRFLPPEVKADRGLEAALLQAMRALDAEDPRLGVTKLQRFIYFAKAAALYAPLVGAEEAVARAAELIFRPGVGSRALAQLRGGKRPPPPAHPPLWMRLLELSEADVERRMRGSSYRILGSMAEQFEALAICDRIGAMPFLVGPPAAGKTVSAKIWARLTGRLNRDVNVSQGFSAREMLGGVGVVTEKDGVRLSHVEGPVMSQAEHAEEDNGQARQLSLHELNTSREAALHLKSAIDSRRRAIDSKADRERATKSSLYLATGNPDDTATQRFTPPPVVADVMVQIDVEERSLEAKVQIVDSQCELDRVAKKKSPNDPGAILRIARLFEDVDALVAKGGLGSRVAPLTLNERDILKVAENTLHFIRRDGVQDADEQRRLLGREAYRVLAAKLKSPDDRAELLRLIRRDKHFGADVEPPRRAHAAQVVKMGGASMLQIGSARLPLCSAELAKAMGGKVPELPFEPVGPQWEVLENILLAWEMKRFPVLVGITGGGKTDLVTYLAHKLGLPLRDLPCSARMTEAKIFGQMTPVKNGFKYEYSNLLKAMKQGGVADLEELLTAPNGVREAINEFLAGNDLEIPNKRPPETIKHKDLSEYFFFVATTNGSDIRKYGFSAAESSRYDVISVNELEDEDDYLTIARRRFLQAPQLVVLNQGQGREQAKNELLERLGARDAGRAALVEALDLALSGKGKPPAEPAPRAKLALDRAGLAAAARALAAFNGEDPRDARVRELVNQALATAEPVALARLPEEVRPLLSPEVRVKLEEVAVMDGRLTDPGEARAAVRFFCKLRGLQKKLGEQRREDAGLSPLTPRVYSNFMKAFLRKRGEMSCLTAASEAARLSLLPLLGPALEEKALKALTECFGNGEVQKLSFEQLMPRDAGHGIYFGKTFIPYGPHPRWVRDDRRFAWTEARVQNLAHFADAFASGQPIGGPDDENGETLEMIREFCRLAGYPMTVVPLARDTNIDHLIEKSVPSDGADSLNGFVHELQPLGRAVADGHVVVIRGGSTKESEDLEQLNGLGDNRQGIQAPRSGKWLPVRAPVVFMEPPGERTNFAESVHNRLFHPPLSTRARENAQLQFEDRAAELCQALGKKCQISENSANQIASLHVFLNEELKKGRRFVSGLEIGSFLNRDAEAVGMRLNTLLKREVPFPEAELLHHLVMEVYGDRLKPSAENDRKQLAKFAAAAFGAKGGQVKLSSAVQPTPHLMMLGEWSVERDPERPRDGVPGPEKMLPQTPTLAAVQQKFFAALQHEERFVQLHGDRFVATASTDSVCRLTTSPLIEVEGHAKMSRAVLFGGIVQNPRTGQLEEHEGLLWQAQREGATLVIKNAGLLPVDVVTDLVEIASSGEVQRVKDGEIDRRPLAFRVVLQTQGDEVLFGDLAKNCRRILCPEVQDAGELEALLRQILIGVPGGPQIASELQGLHAKTSPLLEREPQAGRMRVRFDSARLFQAARELAQGYRERELEGDAQALERSVADVLKRLYLNPVLGFDAEAKVRKQVDEVVAALEGPMVAETIEPIDFVERPALAALKADYQEAQGQLTAAAMDVLGDAVEVVLARGKVREVQALLRAVADAPVLSDSIRQGAATVLERVNGQNLPELVAGFLRLHQKERRRPEGDFGAAALSFMQSARLWDIEHRQEILAMYEALFSACSDLRSPLGEQALQTVQRVRERFDASGALAKVFEMREQVGRALQHYRDRKGAQDVQLTDLYKDLIRRWDTVSTTTIFKEHHQLRIQLMALGNQLHKIEMAHAERPGSATEEVQELVGALAGAGRLLEVLRLAERSAELRRDLDYSVRASGKLVEELRATEHTILELQGAKSEAERLAVEMARVRELLPARTLAELRFDPEEVHAPDPRAAAELRAEAERRAQEIVQPEVAKKRVELYLGVEARAAKEAAPVVAELAQSALEGPELGIGAAPARPSPTSQVFAAVQEELTQFQETRLDEERARIHGELKKADEDRVRDLYRHRLVDEVKQKAAKASRAAASLARELQGLAARLDLAEGPLAAAVEKNVVALHKFVEETDGWSQAAWRFFTGWLPKAMQRFLGRPDQPDFEPLRRDAVGLLKKIEAECERRVGALPDYRQIPDFQGRLRDMAENLVDVRNMGELASRYKVVAEAVDAAHYQEIQPVLRAALGRLGAEAQQAELLIRLANFSENADRLSQAARSKGADVPVVQVLEVVTESAEELRSISLAAPSFARAVERMGDAIQRVDRLGRAAPRWLQELKAEMVELRRRIRDWHGEAGVLAGKKDAAAEMLRTLARESEQAAGTPQPAIERGRVEAPQQTLVDRAAEQAKAQALERMMLRTEESTPLEQELEVVRRPTEVRVIRVGLEPLPLPDVPDPEARPERTPPELETLEQVERARLELAAAAEAAVGDLEQRKEEVHALLGELHKVLGARAVGHWAEELGRAGDLLQEMLGQGEGGVGRAHIRLNRAAQIIQRALEALRGSEDVPPPALAELEAQQLRVAEAVAACESDRFQELAARWAADAAPLVRAVQGALGERAIELRSQAVGGGEAAPVLEELSRVVEAVGSVPHRFGAWSRFRLLAQVHGGLNRLAGALPEEGVRPRAEALLARVVEIEARLQKDSGGERGEELLALLYETHRGDMAEALSFAKKLTKKAGNTYEQIAQGLARLLGPAGTLDETLALTQELAGLLEEGKGSADRRLAAASQRVGQAVTELERVTLARKLAEVETGWRQQARPRLATMREAELRLDAAAKAFRGYDPMTSEGSREEVARELSTALAKASEVLTGPLAIRLSERVVELFREIQGGSGVELKGLERQLGHMLPVAEALVREVPDAPARLHRMVERWEAKLEASRAGELRKKSVSWAEASAKALVELLEVGHDEIGARLKAVEAKFFGDLAKERAAEEEKQERRRPVVPKVRNAVKEALEGTEGRLGLAGKRGEAASLGAGQGGDSTPPEMPGFEPSDVQGTAKPERRDAATLDSRIDVRKTTLAPGKVTERSADLEPVRVSKAGVLSIKKRLLDAAKEVEAQKVAPGEPAPPDAYQAFCQKYDKVIDALAGVLRQVGGRRVYIQDRSDSTKHAINARERDPETGGPVRIIDVEALLTKLFMAAEERCESPYALVSFGARGVSPTEARAQVPQGNGYNCYVFVDKPTEATLSSEQMSALFGVTTRHGGFTELIESFKVAKGQVPRTKDQVTFVCLTDAKLGNARDVREAIANLREKDKYGVIGFCFGEAVHATQTFGEYGEHYASVAEALEMDQLPDGRLGALGLFKKGMVESGGALRGEVAAAAAGIGAAESQLPMAAAPPTGPVAGVGNLGEERPERSDPPEVLVSAGPEMAQRNLTDRNSYDRAARDLARYRAEARRDPAYRALLVDAQQMRAKLEANIVPTMRDAIAQSMPKTDGAQWVGRRLEGTEIDEDAIADWKMGQKTGFPVLNIWMEQVSSEKIKSRVVLSIDRSDSEADEAKTKSAIEALIAMALAYRAVDPDIEIAVTSFGKDVLLHHPFEQPLDDEALAYLLYSLAGTRGGTGDERSLEDNRALLRMTGTENGEIVMVTDGQGMPGAASTAERIAREGYMVMVVGPDPESRAVLRFGDQSLAVDTPPQLALRLKEARLRAYAKRGRPL